VRWWKFSKLCKKKIYKVSLFYNKLYRVISSFVLLIDFSLNSPCNFIILDIHQQNAQITNKVQSVPYHSQTLHMFRLFINHHQGFFNSAFQMLDRSANDTIEKTPDDGS
jgi:hypothetical protein